MSIKKQFLKSKPICKVTFRIPKQIGKKYNKAFVMGEFNNWTPGETPMEKLKSGDFKCTVALKSNASYSFRYLLDKEVWLNEEEADAQIANEFGETNCVVCTGLN